MASSSVGFAGDWFYAIGLVLQRSGSACVVDEPEFDADGNPATIAAQAQSVCCDSTMQKESPIEMACLSSNGSLDCLPRSTECRGISDTSMRAMSLRRRIQSNAIAIEGVKSYNKIVRLKNLRKVYSFTVGELSWQFQDLAEVYGDECVDNDPTLCHGLRYNLSSSGSVPSQHLLVESRFLPTEVRANSSSTGRLLPFVSFVSSQQCDDCNPIPPSTDLVLPRRFTDVTGFVPDSEAFCYPDVGSYSRSKGTNHLYIEKSLQPAYTAAMFYLFQDGVARDALNTSTSSSTGKAARDGLSLTEPLAYLRNTQLIDVKRMESKLQQMATAHTIAEVLIDDKKFPSLLLPKTALITLGDDDTPVMK
ncbi:hypothetical protein Gpo141_00003015 [Globisporangium polare]